jgi:broad specificity phosphatase PhoE
LKVLEIRRHMHRDENENLTEEGKRIVGDARQTLEGGYRAVYTSPRRRAILTLEEFGFHRYVVESVLAVSPLLEKELPRYQAQIDELKLGMVAEAYFAFPEVANLIMKAGKVALDRLHELTNSLNEGERAFAISHGGLMEAMALQIIGGDPDLDRVGGRFHACEGFKAFLVEGGIVRLDLIRLV